MPEFTISAPLVGGYRFTCDGSIDELVTELRDFKRFCHTGWASIPAGSIKILTLDQKTVAYHFQDVRVTNGIIIVTDGDTRYKLYPEGGLGQEQHVPGVGWCLPCPAID